MQPKSIVAQRIQELRKEQKITQKKPLRGNRHCN